MNSVGMVPSEDLVSDVLVVLESGEGLGSIFCLCLKK